MDVWSNHACQVALFFPGVRTASSGGSVNLVRPRPQEMHPSATGTREPTGCVISKATKEGLPRWSCCHWIGQGMHPTPSIRSESERELLDLHFHRRPRPEFQDTVGTCRTKKAKTKASDPIQRRIAKGNERPPTKLGDDQERRPFPKWRKGSELLASTKKTQWMRTAKKVQQRKPAPPIRKNRPEQKNTKKTETASKTGANQKTYPQGKQGKGGNVDSTLQPGITAHWKTTQEKFSKARRRETRCRILWSTRSPSHKTSR